MTNIDNVELDHLIHDNQNLIHSIASQYDYYLREDLFQVGVMGMIDAYSHYDPNRSTKFSSYAYPYILGEMKKYLREDRNIRVSRDLIYLCSKIEKAKEYLRQKLRREPSINDIAFFLEISESKIVEAIQANISIKSIDEPINDEGRELTIQDVVSIKETYDKLDLISLRDELSKLSTRDKELLEKRYYEEHTQSETAMLMGMSQVDVSRTEKKLILTLRNKLQ